IAVLLDVKDIPQVGPLHRGRTSEPLLLNKLLCSDLGLGQRMRFDRLRRREFLTLLGGAAVARPLAARARHGERMRRIGVLMPFGEDHSVAQARLAAFLQGLQQLSWIDGRNMRIDYRWSAGDANLTRKFATELIALEPEVVMAFTSAAVAPLRQATSTVPIVFAVVADPVGAGYVESLARPSGNITGFAAHEYAVSGKWIALLKELVPQLRRVAVLRDSALAAGPGQFGALQALAPSFGIELRPLDVHDPVGIEQGIAAFAKGSNNNGLIVTGSPS